MSYNIDSVDYVSGKLMIKRRDAQAFVEDNNGNIPEGNFLDELDLSVKLDPEEMLVIEKPWWYGEGSGHDFDTFKEALALTKGKAQLLLVWEGGDSQTGLLVKDGVVMEKKVKTTLED